jgi:hypothetical protein
MGAGKSHFQQNESYYRGRNNKLLPDFAKYKEAPLIKNRPRIFKNEGLSYKKNGTTSATSISFIKLS